MDKLAMFFFNNFGPGSRAFEGLHFSFQRIALLSEFAYLSLVKYTLIFQLFSQRCVFRAKCLYLNWGYQRLRRQLNLLCAERGIVMDEEPNVK